MGHFLEEPMNRHSIVETAASAAGARECTEATVDLRGAVHPFPVERPRRAVNGAFEMAAEPGAALPARKPVVGRKGPQSAEGGLREDRLIRRRRTRHRGTNRDWRTQRLLDRLAMVGRDGRRWE